MSAGRVAFWLLFAAAALLRLSLLDRHGLWADELFSLAMATGHSLEHPATKADPSLGDYVEAREPQPPAAYARYLEHEAPPAGPDRVVRAVLLSDTSPPLYYLLLYGWTRVLGTGDAALRLFSLAWALACFPVVWSLARQVGGRAVAVPTGVLFTFSPLCVFYSTEGRMYSLVWFWTVCLMWLALRLWRRGFRPVPFLAWVAIGAAGLLTHYFFFFVWAAALAWLFLHPGRLPRVCPAAAAVLVGLLALPWYVRLPESLSAWRVTSTWLNASPPFHHLMLHWLFLLWSYFSVHGVWGVPFWFDVPNGAVFVALAAAVWRRCSRTLFRPRRRLLWLWLAAACLGPVAFDLLRGTSIVTQSRYSLAGMPAAFLLLGYGVSRLPPGWQALFLGLIVLMWQVSSARMYTHQTRASEPFRQIGHLLAAQTGPADLVIVHSIPSGVAGVARYMEAGGASTKGVGFVSWVGQLNRRRVPDDIQRVAAGYRRVLLVKLHDLDEPAPQEEWLRRHAESAGEYRLERAAVYYFTPRAGGKFAAPWRE